MPSVFAAGPDLGIVLTTLPLMTYSTLSAVTRTSSAFVDIPLASAFFTASLGDPDEAICAVEFPFRLLISQVPSLSTMKYVYDCAGPSRSLPPKMRPRYSEWPLVLINLNVHLSV